MIIIENLHKRFGKKILFENLYLQVQTGEVFVVIGPSGSGKSSLLRCIIGLEPFQKGRIIISGIEIQGNSGNFTSYPFRRERIHLGMVFQQFNLFPHMTVMENLMEAPVQVLKRSKKNALNQAKNLLKKVNLPGFGKRYPASLSGGEQQRVAIARALAMNPECILFDEPTSALDPETVGDVLRVMRLLADEGMTLIIATHEMDFAREVADRIVMLDSGSIVESGTPKDFFQNPKQERTRSFLKRILER